MIKYNQIYDILDCIDTTDEAGKRAAVVKLLLLINPERNEMVGLFNVLRPFKKELSAKLEIYSDSKMYTKDFMKVFNKDLIACGVYLDSPDNFGHIDENQKMVEIAVWLGYDVNCWNISKIKETKWIDFYLNFDNCKKVFKRADVLTQPGSEIFANSKGKFNYGFIKDKYNLNHHLYILSDREIEPGDWWFDTLTNDIGPSIIKDDFDKTNFPEYILKIIATTNTNLGLPEPSKDSIEIIINEHNYQ